MGMTLLSAYGWFAGLLVVMIVVTALFALILWIALKPIKKDELDDSASTKKALTRREAELTNELLNKRHDAGERAELEKQLREVKSAERLVGELMDDGEEPESAPERPARAAKAPQRQVRPARPAEDMAEYEDAPAARPVRQARPVRPAEDMSEYEDAPAARPVRQARPVRPAEDMAEYEDAPAARPVRQARPTRPVNNAGPYASAPKKAPGTDKNNE